MWSIFDMLHKNFHEDQLNSRRFPGFPGGFLNSSRFPGFPGVVDTLFISTFWFCIGRTETSTEKKKSESEWHNGLALCSSVTFVKTIFKLKDAKKSLFKCLGN